MSKIISVTQLNTYIKSLLEGDNILVGALIQGEISNYKKHLASGHSYFTLKDENASISAVMFKGSSYKLPFELEDGLKVIVKGKVSIYEKTGGMQVYVTDVQPDGIGALTLAFEQLKEKLNKEGLFLDKHKKEIPKFPKKIGIVTSKSGAALQDILNIIKRRYPLVEVLLHNVNVQGESASADIANALIEIDKTSCDVIITGRGGGSIEDLWAFNEEVVARAIFSMKTPVISAVGHEIDFTIADLVADLRAPTPSAAAELVTPDQASIISFIKNNINNQKRYIELTLNLAYEKIDYFKDSKGYIKVRETIRNNESLIENISYKNNVLITTIIQKYNRICQSEISKLEALSPIKTLIRGYSIIEKNGTIVDTVDKIEKNDNINIILSDGKLIAEVTEKVKE